MSRMSGDLDHVARPALPWRDESLTECGIESPRTISRQEFYDRVKAQGQQRASMGICMTCWHTCQRHAGHEGLKAGATQADVVAAFVDVWRYDPAGVLDREVTWDKSRRDRLNRELWAIAMVVQAHRDEFDAALDGMDAAPSLADLRARKQSRQQMGGRR